MNKLKDPADKGAEIRENKELSEKEKSLSFNTLTLEDFKAVPKQAARIPHPFEGYPEKKMKIGTYMEGRKKKDLIVNATHIVGLNPTFSVVQDPSGEGIAIGKPGKGEKVVTIESTHNRIVSYAGQSFDAVFDRTLELKDGQKIKYCIIPDPIFRAQIIYFYNTKLERIDVYPQYMLLDDGQTSRLRQVFQMIINPKLRIERIAKAITGESSESLDDLTHITDNIGE